MKGLQSDFRQCGCLSPPTVAFPSLRHGGGSHKLHLRSTLNWPPLNAMPNREVSVGPAHEFPEYFVTRFSPHLSLPLSYFSVRAPYLEHNSVLSLLIVFAISVLNYIHIHGSLIPARLSCLFLPYASEVFIARVELGSSVASVSPAGLSTTESRYCQPQQNVALTRLCQAPYCLTKCRREGRYGFG